MIQTGRAPVFCVNPQPSAYMPQSINFHGTSSSSRSPSTSSASPVKSRNGYGVRPKEAAVPKFASQARLASLPASTSVTSIPLTPTDKSAPAPASPVKSAIKAPPGLISNVNVESARVPNPRRNVCFDTFDAHQAALLNSRPNLSVTDVHTEPSIVSSSPSKAVFGQSLDVVVHIKGDSKDLPPLLIQQAISRSLEDLLKVTRRQIQIRCSDKAASSDNDGNIVSPIYTSPGKMSPRRSVSPTHSKRIGKPISEINASECSPIVQPMSQPTTVQSLKLEDREIKAGDAAEGRKYKNRNIWTDARSPIVTSDHTKNFDASDCPTVVKTQTGKQWDASEDKHQDARKHSSVFEGSIAEGKERSTSKSLPSGTNTVVRTLSSIFGLSHQKLGAGPTLALSCEPVQVNVKAHDRELEISSSPQAQKHSKGNFIQKMQTVRDLLPQPQVTARSIEPKSGHVQAIPLARASHGF